MHGLIAPARLAERWDVSRATRRHITGWQGKVAPIPEDGIVRWEVIDG